MTSQPPESWRARQRRVLTQFSEQSGKTAEQIAVDADLTYWRYVRFSRGATDLPAQYLPTLARAYGVAPLALIKELGLLGEVGWSARAAMEAAGLDQDWIARVESSLVDWDEPDQRVIVERTIADHQKASAESERHRSAS